MDDVIFHRVAMILAEMGLHDPICLVDDFDPDSCTRNVNESRLYEFHLEIRDDVDTTEFAREFSRCLELHNKISSINASLYEALEYPGTMRNWHTVYVTVIAV